jgi:hypothetical protein
MKKIVFCIFLLISSYSFAQQDLTLYHMRSIPQSIYVNPAGIPTSKVNIGLPAISSNYLSISNSGFKWNDVVQKRADDSLVLNMNNLIGKLAKKNYFVAHANIDLLSLGIKVKKSYFTFNATEKINSTFTYPKGLIQLFWEGNGGDLLGQRASFDGIGYDFVHYREYALGIARPINDRLTIGGRAKYLTGFQNIWTKKSQIGLTTSETNFDLIFDGSLEIKSSGINKINEGDFNINDLLLNNLNKGIALDLGAQYQYSDNIYLSASLLDFGYINWKNDVKNFTQKDFEFVFSGIDLNDFISSDSTAEGALEVLLDSISNVIVLTESEEAYTKWLSSRLILGGTYKLNESNFVGAIFQAEFLKGSVRPALSFSYNTKVKRWFSFALNYSIYNRSMFNFGTGFSINAGPVQFYAVTDNFLAPLLPHMVRNAHLRFGLNLTFGRSRDTSYQAAPSFN